MALRQGGEFVFRFFVEADIPMDLTLCNLHDLRQFRRVTDFTERTHPITTKGPT